MIYDYLSSVTSQVAAEASATALRNIFEHQALQREQLSRSLAAMEEQIRKKATEVVVAERQAEIALQEVQAALERQRTPQAQAKLLADLIAYNWIIHYYNQMRLLDERALSEVSTAVREALDQRLQVEGLIDRTRGARLLEGLRQSLSAKPAPAAPIAEL